MRTCSAGTRASWPLAKAEALAEAKAWLRGLTVEQAEVELSRPNLDPAVLARGGGAKSPPGRGLFPAVRAPLPLGRIHPGRGPGVRPVRALNCLSSGPRPFSKRLSVSRLRLPSIPVTVLSHGVLLLRGQLWQWSSNPVTPTWPLIDRTGLFRAEELVDPTA